MNQPEGTPIWYELMTNAPANAQRFYGGILPWSFEIMPNDLQMEYRVCAVGDKTVAGILPTPEHAKGMPNTWFVYFGVNDVDISAQKVKSLGGSVDIEPTDIPNIGRFAFCADPQGAPFYLMRGSSEEQSTAFTPATTGHCSWNELVTTDQVAAFEFYHALLGWERAGSMPMGGDMGDYTFISHNQGMIGAMMNSPIKGEKPYWNFAMQVADIDEAVAQIEKSGGTVRMGPSELPEDNGWLVQITDPQGAKIMLTGPREK